MITISFRKMRLLGGLLLCVSSLWSVGAQAASDCAIGLMTSEIAPTVDGQDTIDEWDDASVLSSGNPCLGQLMDYVSATSSYPLRNVTVKSKKYMRSGIWYLGFLFEVRDLTSAGPCLGNTKLCIGEKIIMQFNRVINGDAKLNVAQDKRFTLTHKWAGTGDSVTDGLVQVDPPVSDASCTPTSGVDVQWGPSAANGINQAIRKNITGGGYRAEIEVPVSFVTGAAGNLANDIGVAFAVVNDFGKNNFGAPPDFDCTVTGTCEGAGLSFPPSLPETNDANPVDAICDKGWVVPKQWGVGYINNPPGQVTISRMPAYWNSNGIEVFECDSVNYTYYPARPCKVVIRATLQNNGATTRRKAVFLWAKHGTGDPTEYNFVDIQDVVVTAGAPAMQVSTQVPSALWSGIPKNEANHPCLRVYIFPDSLSTVDENILRGTGGVVTRAQLNTVVAANGVEEQHWAQKNISRHATTTQCPDATCRVPISLNLISSAIADTSSAVTGTRADGEDTGQTPETRALLLSEEDRERYAKDHVIVQLRTVAYQVPASGSKPKFNFIEDFGGVVQLFPVAMVEQNRELPIEFQVSNGSDATMRVKVLVDVHTPANVSATKVVIPEQELTLQPRSVVTVKGSVENPNVEGKCPSSCGPCKKLNLTSNGDWGLPGALVLVGGIAGVGGFAFRKRRRPAGDRGPSA